MPLFTSENAAKMGRKGAMARWVEPEEPPQAPPIAPGWVQVRLLRVRKEIERIDALLAKETSATELRQLADTLAKLADQERILDGRPLPGQLRPTPKVTRKSLPPPTSSSGQDAEVSTPPNVVNIASSQ